MLSVSVRARNLRSSHEPSLLSRRRSARRSSAAAIAAHEHLLAAARTVAGISMTSARSAGDGAHRVRRCGADRPGERHRAAVQLQFSALWLDRSYRALHPWRVLCHLASHFWPLCRVRGSGPTGSDRVRRRHCIDRYGSPPARCAAIRGPRIPARPESYAPGWRRRATATNSRWCRSAGRDPYASSWRPLACQRPVARFDRQPRGQRIAEPRHLVGSGHPRSDQAHPYPQRR